MKYVAFFGFALVAVPGMAFLSMQFAAWRGRLLGLLVFSTVLGDLASINFFSMESYRGPDRGFEVTLTELIALGLLAGLVARPAGIRWLPTNTLLMASFFGIALISAIGSPDPLVAGFTLWKLLRVFVIYWVVVNSVARADDLKPVWAGLVAAGLFVAWQAFKQKYLGGVYRVSGPFDHSNTVPLYLNLFLPVLLAWGMADRTLRRWQAGLTLVAAAGMAFAVLATFSRAGAALTGAAGLAVVVLVNLRGSGMRARAVGVAVMLTGLTGASLAADSFIERIRNAPESSAHAREEFNRAAIAMAMDHPIGVGINSFPLVLTGEAEYRKHIRVMENEEHAGVAHHIYLLTAAETGWVGLAVFVIIMLRFAGVTLVGAFRVRGPDRFLLWGALIGFGTLGASGFLEWAYRITPVTYMWAVMSAFAVGLVVRANRVPIRDQAV